MKRTAGLILVPDEEGDGEDIDSLCKAPLYVDADEGKTGGG